MVNLLELVEKPYSSLLQLKDEVLSESVAQTHELLKQFGVEVHQAHIEPDRDLVRVLSKRFNFLFESGSELQLSVVRNEALLHFQLMLRVLKLMLEKLLAEGVIVERLRLVSALGGGTALTSRAIFRLLVGVLRHRLVGAEPV